MQEYHDYFLRQNEKSEIKKVLKLYFIADRDQTELDPVPRVILVENLGLVTGTICVDLFYDL